MDGSPLTPHSSQLQLDKATGSVAGEGGEVVPFSVSPSSGQILPGKDTIFSVSFSPLDVREWECKLVCRYIVRILGFSNSVSSRLAVFLTWTAPMNHWRWL